MSCMVGLLTVFYHFLLSSRYVWNAAAAGTTIGAGVSSVVYFALLIWTHRKSSRMTEPSGINLKSRLFRAKSSAGLAAEHGGDANYYQNYNQNMFPASYSRRTAAEDHGTNGITYDEMQRQQMLMLLSQRDSAPSPASQNTFRIDWQDQEDAPMQHGYYAPLPSHEWNSSSRQAGRQASNEHLHSRDGVQRGSGPPLSTSRA